MASVMISMHETLMQFWVEAINTACYIANRIFLRRGSNKTSYELWTSRNLTLSTLRLYTVNVIYSGIEITLEILMLNLMWNKTYRVYNQNLQVIQESSNVVINNTEYDRDIIDKSNLAQELTGDNFEDLETTKYNPNDIPESNIDPNMNEVVPLDDT